MTVAQKRLLTQEDIEVWTSSETYQNLVAFIEELGESVVGKENSQINEPVSEGISNVVALIKDIQTCFLKHPVEKEKETSRFGKLEFRDFFDELKDSAVKLINSKLTTLDSAQSEELSTYLIHSFGDRQRIDYGSGHELNFLCFLYGLYRFGIFSKDDFTNIILVVFIDYLELMRSLEKEYWLEPAGSHGVWGLDDYHFLPFLFGAFQLATHKHLRPKSIHNGEVVEMFANRYLYFGCIAFISSIKSTASLRWHSPMLDDISIVKTWAKVSEGMVKMYRAEVLGKLPIMQHFYFGSFLHCPEGISLPDTHHSDEEHGCSHLNAANTWGDCCGIKVPSAIAANEASAMKKKKYVKPIPFD